MTDTTDLADRWQDGSLAGRWVLSPDRTTVAFRSTSMWGLVKVNGRFNRVQGEGTFDPSGAISGRLVIDVASVDTGKAKRDTHLKSTDFFDAATNNHITFLATDVAVKDDNRLYVSGELTIAGQSHPYSLDVTVTDLDETGVTLAASAVIDRSQWGIAWTKLGMTNMDTGVDIQARFTRR
ncbi:MAG: YceI family protein [Acidimicrobiales bacterium]